MSKVQLKYARLSEASFIPGLGKVGPELNSVTSAGSKSTIMWLKDGLVTCTQTGAANSKSVTFLIPATSFQILLPNEAYAQDSKD